MVATAALCFAGSSFAQENAGGDSASSSAFGDMNKEKIVAGAVAVGVLGAMVANNRGNAKPVVIVDPPPVDPTCSGSDPLVDGVCTGTTTTVTVSGTGTGTTTVTVPVTFTYLPTV
jgi:hypothetical protein